MNRQLCDNRYNNAISALTYGFNCFIWDSQTKRIYECILSIHEEYINILHIIIEKKASYLLKLHEIYNITDSQYSTENNLKQFKLNQYLILYTQSLDSFIFAFKTEHEKESLKIAMFIFVREAKLYYERLNEFDPFKAEAMITFLHADKDGGNLLDIQEIVNILEEMKIYKEEEQILRDIQQINSYLYDRQKLKRPTNMKNTQLNQLGFQYLLRFYSIKEDLCVYFSNFCPMYKSKSRTQKTKIVDIVRYNQKPIMSHAQLHEFYHKILRQTISEQACLQLIKSFPVYDGEGKEKQQQHDMISFNNFCSLISSKRNSAYMEQKKDIYQKTTNPLVDYFVYSDFSDYSKTSKGRKMNFYELSLKRGCRCMLLNVEASRQGNPIVKIDPENSTNIEEVLKIIVEKAFEFNNFPFILEIKTNDLKKSGLDQLAKSIVQIFDDYLYKLPNNYAQLEHLPPLNQLTRKILIMSNTANLKLFKAKEKDFPEESFAYLKTVSLFAIKLDFERKGYTAWNYCSLEHQKIKKIEEVQDENLSNYSKMIMIKTAPGLEKGVEMNNPNSMFMRLGIQISGLTFTNISEQNYVMKSLFLQNGGSKGGFILKPNWMCLKNPKTMYSKNFENPQFILNVKAVSGQNCIINDLPKGQSYFLQVYVRGTKRQEQFNKTYTSQSQKTGYYTKFGLQCQFQIYCMDLAILVLLVRSQKTKYILSARAIPIRHLKEGLRPVYLLGQHFKENFSSYILIHSGRKQVAKKMFNNFDLKN